MEAMLDAGLQFTVDELKKHGLFNMQVMAAVDKHKVARHDHDHGYFAGGKHGRGTSWPVSTSRRWTTMPTS